MTREEAIEVLQKSTDNTIEMTIREWEEFDKKVAEALDMAIEALQNEEILKTQLANCHKEILRLLDFNDSIESPNDVVEYQDDVIEVVRCKDCEHRYWDKTSEFWTCYHTMDLAIDDNDFCSLGERREP